MYFCLKDTIQETCGWIAAVVNLYFFITPIKPFINLLKGKITFEETPGIFTTICYINCVCFYTYGELTFSDQMRLSYIIGSAIFLILIMIYLYYEIRKYIFDSILNFLILATGTYSVYVGLTVILDDDQIAAKFCNATSLAYFFFPIQTIYKVITYKNYKIIAVKYNWIHVFTSFNWTVYGALILENLLVYPHVINIILCLIQLYIYYSYKKKYPSIEEKDNNNDTIGIESNSNEEGKNDDFKIKGFEEENSNIKNRPVKIVENANN